VNATKRGSAAQTPLTLQHRHDHRIELRANLGHGGHSYLSPDSGTPAMICIFVQIRCKPSTAYDVAEALALRELHSEIYSTSGDFDLLAKFYVAADQDVGRFVNDAFKEMPDVERTLTTLTFKTF
jgi:DNA-binding Lrp family transcriptional regulator